MTTHHGVSLAGLVALPFTALAVAGCGGGDDTTSASKSSASSAGSSGSAEVLHLSADPSGRSAFSTKSLSAKSGKVTIVMKNPSSAGVEHGVAVEGNGVDKDGQIVAPGGTSTVSASLGPGTYRFYCPFDSHEEQGMTGTLTVK